jgi:hypothetical protein
VIRCAFRSDSMSRKAVDRPLPELVGLCKG